MGTKFIPPRLDLVKNENSMPLSPQPFAVKLEGLYKIVNGKLVGKLEELTKTQEVMTDQVCEINESHFKVNTINFSYPGYIGVTGYHQNGSISYYHGTETVHPGGITFTNYGTWQGPGQHISAVSMGYLDPARNTAIPTSPELSHWGEPERVPRRQRRDSGWYD